MSKIRFESESSKNSALLQDDKLRDLAVHILVGAIASVFSLVCTKRLIGASRNYFLKELNLFGKDMGKAGKPEIPESMGIVVGLTYITSFIMWFIIAPYVLTYYGIIESFSLSDKHCSSDLSTDTNGYSNGLCNFAAITSIFGMLMLGFIDDCYDLRWRYKLMFPFAASLPLVGVYYYIYRERTIILVPHLLIKYFDLGPRLDLGMFYFIYMFMFVIFCTNAINIYAGINGLEVGQSILLTITIILYNFIEIRTKQDCDEVHIFSLQLLFPFLFGSFALYEYNRYPAKVFVGDSYCYFAGIIFGVVGILGHFSEEILFFSLPQIFNFMLSIPQIFKFVPCPRHRLPQFDGKKNLMKPSMFKFKYEELNFLGRFTLKTYSFLGFARIKPPGPRSKTKEMSSNNLTLLNLWLVWFGPKHEKDLCWQLLLLQSCLATVALSILAATKSGYIQFF